MSNSLFRKKSLEKIHKDAEEGITDGHGGGGLKKVLNVRDLTFMGIAAVVGAGIFSTIGKAAFDGGPGISILFIITAVTCGFSALCYAEFASRIPIAGSAYTYAYVSFGELVAWIIGWALILEYAIGNIVVAISWSGCFYHKDDKEISSRFIQEGEVGWSPQSFLLQQKGTEYIQALERTHIVTLSLEHMQCICRDFPLFASVRQRITEAALLDQEQRMQAVWMQRSDEKLAWFSRRYPGLLDKLTGRHIASYLGITEVMLSRLRRWQ